MSNFTEEEDFNLSAQEALQEELLGFLIHIKEDCGTTQSVIDNIVIGIDKVQKKVLAVIEGLLTEKAGVSGVLSIADVSLVLGDLKQSSLFSGFQSNKNILDHMLETGGLVLPRRVSFLDDDQSAPSIRNGKIVNDGGDFFYQVDFLPQLERLLCAGGVLKCVDNARKPEAWTYTSITDGIMYTQHAVVKKHGDGVLSVTLFHDGVEMVDKSSSRIKKHNMTFFFWVLANIYPELRSTDKVIQLYAVVKTTDLKMYGYQKILKNFTEGINQLSSEEGVDFNINGAKRNFHGICQCAEGDHPAQMAFGGYKESVSAESPCRECHATQTEDYLQVTDISQFALRNLVTHKKQLEEVLNYKALTQKERAKTPNPSVKYGINSRGALMDINYFDPTKMLPMDLMHVAHEGVVELMCRVILIHVIVEKESISLGEVNKRIAMLSKAFPKDRPGIIESDHLKSDKILRQSAAQMYVLFLLLPFVLQKEADDGTWTFAGDKEVLECFLLLSKAMHLCLAFKHNVKDVEKLRTMIQNFHTKLLKLVEGLAMAKVHFMHHLADLIVLFGSIRQLSCFRNEAHHAYFKRLLKIMHNFTNPMMSMSVRHQMKQWKLMMKDNFLYDGHKYTEKEDVSHVQEMDVNQVRRVYPNCQKIVEVTKAVIHGTSYQVNTLVLLNDIKPVFGKIKRIFLVDDICTFVCRQIESISRVEAVNAFQIYPLSKKIVIEAEKLVHPHTVCNIKWKDRQYALPLSHRSLLT